MSDALAQLIRCCVGQACDTEARVELENTSRQPEMNDSATSSLPPTDRGITDFRPVYDDQTVVQE